MFLGREQGREDFFSTACQAARAAIIKPPRSRPGLVIMSRRTLVWSALVLAFGGFVFYSLARVELLKVISSRLERQGAAVFVEGRLKNRGPEVAAADLEVHYYNEHGQELASDRLVLEHLGRGAVTSFKTPERRLEGVSSYSIYLNRGRSAYGN